MKIFKPTNNSNADCLEPDDDFFKYSHGMRDMEFTLCGVACEEWGYTHEQPRRRITCPECLALIRLCKSYKL